MPSRALDAGERNLHGRGEDAQADVAVAGGRIDEDGLRERHLPREELELVLGNGTRVCEDRELVPRQRAVREDIADDIAEPTRHGRGLYPRLVRSLPEASG